MRSLPAYQLDVRRRLLRDLHNAGKKVSPEIPFANLAWGKKIAFDVVSIFEKKQLKRVEVYSPNFARNLGLSIFYHVLPL